MATNLPFDYENEQKELDRKRAISEAMLQAAMQQKGGQGQMVGNHFVAPSPLAALVPIAQMLASQKMNERVAGQAKDLRDRYNTDLAAGMEKYFNTREGKPAIMGTAGPEQALAGGGGPTVENAARLGQPYEVSPAVKGDPRRAAIEAVTSGFAPLQQVGMKDLETLGKNTLTTKDVLGLSGYDPKSKIAAAMAGDYSKLAPETKEHVVNGRVVAGRPEAGYKSVGDFRERYGPTTYVNGEAVQFEQGTGKAHQVATRPTQVKQTTVNQGESEFMKTLGRDTGELVKQARLQKKSAQQMNFTANRLEQLNEQGVFSGPTANLATTVAAFADTLGAKVDKEKLARSEEYAAIGAQQVAKVLMDGSVGRSMTDEDRKRFEQQFPQLINSPEGRTKIIGMLRGAAAQDEQYANQVEINLKEQFPDAARLFAITPTNIPYPDTDLPGGKPAPAAAPAKVRRYNPATGRIE